MILRSFLAMAAVCAAWPAAALTTRPDRDDAEYVELASKYPSSIALGASAGEAVLIAPRWLLTGARQAEKLKSSSTIDAAGAQRGIRSVYIHPSNAIALVLLRDAITGVEPSPIYRQPDENGRTVAFVGHGRGAARAGINTVDRVTASTLSLDLKPLDAASDLQGALTADELGAPLFVEVKSEPFVAGIAIDANARSQTFARISSYAGWIDDTLWAAAKTGTYPVSRENRVRPGFGGGR